MASTLCFARRAILCVILASSPAVGLPAESFQLSTPAKHDSPLADDVLVLQPGKTVERKLTRGEADSYAIFLAVGEHIGVTVEQRGVNVSLRLLDPTGIPVLDINLESDRC